MSGEGITATHRPRRWGKGWMSAIVAERLAVHAHAERYCRDVEAMIGKGQISADAASELTGRVREFAQGITIGLHVGGEDAPEVRRAIRDGLKGAAPQ